MEIINVDDGNGRGSSENLTDVVHPSNMEVSLYSQHLLPIV